MRRRARRASSGRRLFAFDRRLDTRFVAGADEAGRGSLAGPLLAAGVLFDYAALTTRDLRALRALNDSKQHTEEAREELFPLVLRSAARVAIISRCVRGLDERGLHKTNLAALREAARSVTADVAGGDLICLLDGFSVADFGRPQRAIVDGDATSAAIAAASIVAKVTRDRYMRHADLQHPGWSFAEHVGYSTPEHREAILRQGVSPLHRMSFQSLAYQQLAL
jgi:ribonuclease HII